MQLLKLNIENSPHMETLETYINLGPIFDFCVVDRDFCVVDREKQVLSQIIACSGAYKDGSLRIIHNAIGTYDEVWIV